MGYALAGWHAFPAAGGNHGRSVLGWGGVKINQNFLVHVDDSPENGDWQEVSETHSKDIL